VWSARRNLWQWVNAPTEIGDRLDCRANSGDIGSGETGSQLKVPTETVGRQVGTSDVADVVVGEADLCVGAELGGHRLDLDDGETIETVRFDAVSKGREPPLLDGFGTSDHEDRHLAAERTDDRVGKELNTEALDEGGGQPDSRAGMVDDVEEDARCLPEAGHDYLASQGFWNGTDGHPGRRWGNDIESGPRYFESPSDILGGSWRVRDAGCTSGDDSQIVGCGKNLANGNTEAESPHCALEIVTIEQTIVASSKRERRREPSPCVRRPSSRRKRLVDSGEC
jgi:hypothetical protein